MYALGGGIAHYLGFSLNWQAFFSGLIICLLVLESDQYFKAYNESLEGEQSPFDPDEKNGQPRNAAQLIRGRLLFLAFSFLTIAAVIVVMMLNQKAIKPISGVILFAMTLGWILDSCAPFRLSRSGFGQILETFLVIYLVPAFALVLQIGSIHRLLPMNIFPLTFFYLAMSIVLDMPGYGEAVRTGKTNLLTVLGCNWGMTLHNILIPVGYLFIGGAMLEGMPWALAWPALLTLPIAVFEVWLIIQIDMGVKPRWRLLTVTSSGLFFLVAYLLTFSVWVR